MPELLTIVLATSNHGKIQELRALLADLPIQFVSAAEVLGAQPSIVEDGATFEANALLKARAIAKATRTFSLADDSGLEVDALAGRPGVRSARFAHEHATDSENNAALLRELENIEEGARGARFRCVLALLNPWRESDVHVAAGSCEGSIARAPRGSGGFGYDPLFVVAGHDGKTMAELSEADKNRVSHRARAVQALRSILVTLVNERLDEAERIAG
ncbi:MAG: RdgB/HAM1 family non-canonical purine NTP pyrophosphatase [Polyangiaceae bacterium]